jgi:hypothetical protein
MGKLRWFAVKTLYRTKATGKPRVLGPHYDPLSTLVEERVVLIRARSSDDAFIRAEHEALRYANSVEIINPYGQHLKTKLLKVKEAFELFDETVQSGSEIYSSTRLVSRALTNREIASQILGQEKIDQRARLKFADAEVMRDALQRTSRR